MGDEGFEVEALAALDRRDRDAALTILMRALGGPVFRYCRQLLGDPAVADDVLQVVFAQAYEHLGGFERRSTLRSWIFTIAHHRCLDVLKARKRWEQRFTPEDAAPEPASGDATADERISARGVGAAVTDCLQRLEPHVRMAVLLRYQEGLAYDDIAKITSERAGTMQARVARAMPLLRRCLEQKGVTP
jgi:RNA polymerase sigma-70 factor (ECF subfamily)